jgi:hypothetical protein
MPVITGPDGSVIGTMPYNNDKGNGNAKAPVSGSAASMGPMQRTPGLMPMPMQGGFPPGVPRMDFLNQMFPGGGGMGGVGPPPMAGGGPPMAGIPGMPQPPMAMPPDGGMGGVGPPMDFAAMQQGPPQLPQNIDWQALLPLLMQGGPLAV